ncbi:nucleotidyltransferase family protein [Ideonella sp. A 288]|uniref:nucleotidyltransferase domain-containing protein n=1 Tax=Ideonella sp. A 288 TaxID=1962181 RepID=UPI001303E1B5|nr:nucleotidyltransferase family protein [Ideonella sp. A 288]
MSGRDLLSGLWVADECPTWSLRDWEDALGQARQCRLQARMALLFQDRGWMDRVPRGPDHYLRNALMAAERQHREVAWEIDCIESALASVDTPVVLLKGAAYLAGGLPAARGRMFSDIDVMVDRPRMADAETALFVAGWIPGRHDAYDERYYRDWMHEIPPLKHVQRGTYIDLHHTIAPPTSRYRVDGSALMARARPLRPGGRLHILCPEDMVLHSAIHLLQEGEFGTGLRDLLDLRELLLHFGADARFWPSLVDRAASLRLAEPLRQVLVQLQRLTGLTWPAEAHDRLVEIEPWGASAKGLSALLTIALRPPHPSSDLPSSPWARWLLYVRSHYVRMPMHQVVPHLVRKAYVRRLRREP